MVNLDPTGQAEQCAAGTRVPVGRAKAGKRRHQIDAVAVRHLGGEVLRIQRFVEHLQFVTQPLHGGAAIEDGAFQRVIHFATRAAGDGGEQAMFGLHRLGPGVHQQEAAGAVGVLRLPGLDAHLAEQRGLLIPGDAGDGNAGALARADVGVPVDLRGGTHFRQHLARDIQRFEHHRIPVQLVNVEQHGARGVGVVGDVGLALGHLPDQPAVDGAEQQFAAAGTLTAALDVVENPLDLGAGEIGVDHQAGGLADVIVHAVALELVADRRALAALPDDGVVDRPAADLVPDDGGLTLVGDADRRHLLVADAGLGQGFDEHAALGRPDFHRIVLDPARLRIDLRELALGDGHHVGVAVQHDGAGAGGALVEGYDVLLVRVAHGDVPQRALLTSGCAELISVGVFSRAAGTAQAAEPTPGRCRQISAL